MGARLFLNEWHWAVAPMLLFMSLLPGCGDRQEMPAGDFIKQHWVEPIPPQGLPPATFTDLEASLSAESCGKCHAAQYDKWNSSLHSRAVGPGLLWQFKLLGQAKANRCMRCHAPLAEQKALLAMEQGWQGVPSQPPPAYVNRSLGHEGITCAVCHVRGHKRFGPTPVAPTQGGTSHVGFVPSSAFEDSQFCAFCHQFPDDGPRVGGKLQEDTYRQWKASPFALGKSCQACHMPDRKHLWRGIHDPEMTRQAIEVDLRVAVADKGNYVARAHVRNVGAGHDFPTYMVPKVDLIFYLHENGSKVRELGRQVIGWTVDTQITREIADTRIPVGKSSEFVQLFIPPLGKKWHVELVVRVRPAEHYERVFQNSLGYADQLPPAALPQLRQALREAKASAYELMRVTAAARRPSSTGL